MNKGCYGSSVGIIIAQFKECDKGHILKSFFRSYREIKFYMKRKSMIYAFTNTALYSLPSRYLLSQVRTEKNDEFNLSKRRQEEDRRN